MVYIALLRAINVGGTGILPMKDLVHLCEGVGFTRVRTHIQSGNVVFDAGGTKTSILKALQDMLHHHMGKPVDVMLRTAPELRAVVEANPFPDGEANKLHIVFLQGTPPAEAHGLTGPAGEQVRNGTRELYLYYPEGIGRSKLKLPLGKTPGTVRNLNTVTKLVAMAEAAA